MNATNRSIALFYDVVTVCLIFILHLTSFVTEASELELTRDSGAIHRVHDWKENMSGRMAL